MASRRADGSKNGPESRGCRARALGSPLLGLLVAALLLAGCATPIAPSGGPPDTTPPRLETSDPADAAVRVRADRLTLTFSEDLDQSSVVRALSLAPEWETPPEVTVRGRRVEVVFPDSLRPNTTYVVGLDTNLRDLRGVALRQPLTLAFATGATLDRGQITGAVLDGVSGRPVAGLDVLAYALPDSASAPPDSLRLPDARETAPDYRTQTGEDGAFRLGYLRPARYFVVALHDADRDRRADDGESFAVPSDPAVPAVVPDSASAPALQLFRTRLDTIPPTPLRVRTRSRARHAVRFDEPVALRSLDADAWRLADTTSGRAITVRAVYADDDPQQVVLVTEPLAGPHRLWLAAPAVTDSSGNAATSDTLVFTPPIQPDTLGLRVLGFLPEAPGARTALAPLDTTAVRFNAAPDTALLGRIAVTDTLGTDVPFALATRDGVRFQIVPETEAPFRVTVPRPDSTYARLFVPPNPDDLGDLVGAAVADGPVVIEVRVGDSRRVARADATGAFAFRGLPEGDVRLRVFVDRDGNGRWDGGRVAPYRAPEPLRFVPAQRIRPRWETVVDTVRFDEAAPGQGSEP